MEFPFSKYTFKRFTKEEREAYQAAYERANSETKKNHDYDRYWDEWCDLCHKTTLTKEEKIRQKEVHKKIEEIVKIAAEEAKPLIKEYFDYEIPIAMVEDAGITSTGAQSAGNQLPQLQKEYVEYKAAHQLWAESSLDYIYELNEDGEILRKINVEDEGVIVHGG